MDVPPTDQSPDTWDKWSNHVLIQLDKQDDCHKELKKDQIKFEKHMAEELKKIAVQLESLKIKSGLWGAAAGLIPAAVAVLYILLKK